MATLRLVNGPCDGRIEEMPDVLTPTIRIRLDAATGGREVTYVVRPDHYGPCDYVGVCAG